MFICSICQKVFFVKNRLISHLKHHLLYGDNVFPLKCAQPNCNYLNHIYDFKSLNRHLFVYHKDDKFEFQLNKNQSINESSSFSGNQEFNDEMENGPIVSESSKFDKKCFLCGKCTLVAN